MSNEKLAELRHQIDAIDERLLELFNARAAVVLKVADAKREEGGKVQFYRPEREAQILRRIQETSTGPLPGADAARLIREVISACLKLEQPLNIAYLGPAGTFTQLAALKHFGQFVNTVPASGIEQVFREVETGHSDFGVVPIENSIEGVIAHTLDTLIDSPLSICGEIELPIHHNLLSKARIVGDVAEVLAHPQALAQCRKWLDEHLPGVPRSAVASNAEGARIASNRPEAAAIASSMASELYDVPILARNIETLANNTTRFLIIGPTSPGPSGRDLTSLVFSIPNKPGALHQVLQAFDDNEINMTRIESRPLRQGSWAYSFFVDIEGHASDPNLERALAELKSRVTSYRLLGSYPRSAL
ncbi:MAG: prephenate dehydratase [Gammaproteobacteria bacterium]|nr:prephenate dehydratase [Gammaproteobacteria bacterium]